MIRWRIIVEFQPGMMGNGIVALKKIMTHLEDELSWPEMKIYRGFIGSKENICEVEAIFESLAKFEEAWQSWGNSPESKMLAERYHQLVQSEKIEIHNIVE